MFVTEFPRFLDLKQSGRIIGADPISIRNQQNDIPGPSRNRLVRHGPFEPVLRRCLVGIICLRQLLRMDSRGKNQQGFRGKQRVKDFFISRVSLSNDD